METEVCGARGRRVSVGTWHTVCMRVWPPHGLRTRAATHTCLCPQREPHPDGPTVSLAHVCAHICPKGIRSNVSTEAAETGASPLPALGESELGSLLQAAGPPQQGAACRGAHLPWVPHLGLLERTRALRARRSPVCEAQATIPTPHPPRPRSSLEGSAGSPGACPGRAPCPTPAWGYLRRSGVGEGCVGRAARGRLW